VVLLNTAVSLLLDTSWNKGMVAGVSVHAVQADVLAQGMSGALENRGCQLISDAEWVELVMRYPHCLSWK
jgi:sulfur transfer complex TusBCD TusB component (DsrH family)